MEQVIIIQSSEEIKTEKSSILLKNSIQLQKHHGAKETADLMQQGISCFSS